MDDIVLKVENLSKQYRLGEVGTGTISHDLNRWWAKFRGKEDPYSLVGQVNDRSKKAESDYVWALKDINFEVKKGEILGIIGKNGAGKSTLLKILSQITNPTTGQIKARGRIAALLEVGTGMHPEMTARENIYLNGAILGMNKKEIASKFDEIVEFSGCAMYVDTPLKRFSSGMRVRLGFAVAAFLEPEILIVDEVLAVGDAEFQKKAIGKMQEISGGGGRTVLFVSHNMVSVRNLCTKGLVLENGGLIYSGTSDEAVNYYLENASTANEQKLIDREDRTGNGDVKFIDTYFLNEANKVVNDIVSTDSVKLVLEYENVLAKDIENVFLGISFYDVNENLLTVVANDEIGFKIKITEKKGKFIIDFPKFLFRAGKYNLSFFLSSKISRLTENIVLDRIENAISINVEKGDYWKTGNINRPNGFILNSSITHET